jgi:hypothetical protein
MNRKTPEEFVVQKFESRCPYCDQPISYDPVDLKAGENPISCPSCQKVFFKIVSPSRRKGKGKR